MKKKTKSTAKKEKIVVITSKEIKDLAWELALAGQEHYKELFGRKEQMTSSFIYELVSRFQESLFNLAEID